VLPVHDSFIIPDSTRNKGELMEAMASSLHKFTANNRDSTIISSKNIPQYGVLPAVPRVFVFFPDLPQRDLFGGDRLAVPASEMLGWRSGPLPQCVRDALRHEARRRGLRQADLASIVNLSRSQLGNLLAGRFGASPEAAARIRDFLIAGAKTVGGPP
jgi:hypothetical protein